MAELGDETDKEHQRILRLLVEIPYEELILVGNNFGRYAAGIKCQPFSTSEAAAEWVKLHPFKDKTILIKGSRSTKMEIILDAI